MKDNIIIYHGSEQIIEKPIFGYGKVHNDYGLGFYCTQTINLAKEWACNWLHSGYANKYNLKTTDLKILNLLDDKFSVQNWIAILLKNRQFNLVTDAEKEAYDFLIDNYLIDYSEYDVIKGYRADDSYFNYAVLFLDNQIGISTLSKALKLGKLGEQIVLKSEKAFNSIQYIESIKAEKETYYPIKQYREKEAYLQFKELQHTSSIKDLNDIRLYRIIDGDIKKDDPRLR